MSIPGRAHVCAAVKPLPRPRVALPMTRTTSPCRATRSTGRWWRASAARCSFPSTCSGRRRRRRRVGSCARRKTTMRGRKWSTDSPDAPSSDIEMLHAKIALVKLLNTSPRLKRRFGGMLASLQQSSRMAQNVERDQRRERRAVVSPARAHLRALAAAHGIRGTRLSSLEEAVANWLREHPRHLARFMRGDLSVIDRGVAIELSIRSRRGHARP